MELTNETRQELSAICEEAIEAAKYAQHMFNTGTHSEALLVANNLVGVFMNIAKDVHGAILIAALEEGAKWCRLDTVAKEV